MNNIFLKAKHWQLFSLLIIIPFLFQIVLMASVFSEFTMTEKPDPFIIFDKFKYIPIVIGLVMIVHYGWFWSVATGLQKFVPEGIVMKVAQFKIFFFVPIIYMILILLFISYMFFGVFEGVMLGLEDGGNPAFMEERMKGFAGMFSLIVPLHLFSIFCMFYMLYFIAKTIKTVELQHVVKFDDFIGEFFLIWFYPIGIWFIQPKINKIVDGEYLSEDDLLDY